MRDQFLGIDLDPHFPGETSKIFSFDARDQIVRDLVSGVLFSQTYLPTNRTRINSAGLLEAVPANTIVIDHIGASLTPALRMEPAGMNLLFNPRFATNGAGFTATATMANSGAIGADGVAGNGLLVTDNSAVASQEMYLGISKAASDSTTYFKATVWVRKVTSAVCYPQLTLAFTGGTAKYAAFIINHIAGTITASATSSTAANIGSRITPSGQGWQVDVWATDNGANTSAYWDFYPAINSDASNTPNVASQGSVTIDYGKISTGAQPSSLFAGAAAIGDELVTDGGFAAVAKAAAKTVVGITKANPGVVTFAAGHGYANGDVIYFSGLTEMTELNTEHWRLCSNAGDTFRLSTAADDSTQLDTSAYVAAETTGGACAQKETFTNWTQGTGWQVGTAYNGTLTGKALKIAGTASALSQTTAAAEAANVYRIGHTAIRTAGTYTAEFGSTNGTAVAANGLYYDYIIATDTDYIKFNADATFAGSIDLATAMKHGTVRISEANTITLATPAAVSAALAATGTLVVNWMPSFARAAGVVNGIISTVNENQQLIYTSSAAGNLSSYDSVNVAASTAAYTANTWAKLAAQWPSDVNKFKVGADVDGAGIAYGTEATFDGAFTTTGNIIYLGKILHGPMYIQWIKFYNKLVSAAQVNAM